MWKNKNIKLTSKVAELRALVTSPSMYASKTCTHNADLQRRIHGMEINISYHKYRGPKQHSTSISTCSHYSDETETTLKWTRQLTNRTLENPYAVPMISAYSWWNCQATHNRLQIEINYFPDSLLFVSAGFLPRVSSQRLN